ncbi:hydroxysteroid 11-beta-dehydrogenase 1-like protein isoform X7 [Branchiostoma floridae]|uniref:Hydroxysteroid 11-beta-dehydrogenase 1-like protein isoform X7 n=1 Tax=Branchiostoma floridae TaxID=7739 RepID=A0A9J7HEB1_BRAFL|nr:hydroxysteroid 11-beta-dehydrogenase 1-like protein isoform X7 [Branchiostoma floridae]
MGKLGWTLALLFAVLVGYIWYEPAFDPESLRGARVVVTGCSTGIGEQMAYHYARLGARVLITARREARLKEVVAKMKDLGAQEAIYVAGDMGKPEDCERTIQTAKEKFGGLDYLVLNHLGTSHKSKKAFLWDGDMEFLHDHVMINYYSYIRLASLALPLLHKTNGSLVVVGSVAGKIGHPFSAFYAATKFGLDGFFTSLRQELVMQDINVSVTYCVLGFIGTEPSQKFQETFQMSKDIKPSPPSDCAMAIIKGGATRQREIYYPWRDAWFVTKLRPLVPDLLDYMTRSIYPPLKEKSPLFTVDEH